MSNDITIRTGYDTVIHCPVCGAPVLALMVPDPESGDENNQQDLAKVTGGDQQARSLMAVGVLTVEMLARLSYADIDNLESSNYGRAKLRAWRQAAQVRGA